MAPPELQRRAGNATLRPELPEPRQGRPLPPLVVICGATATGKTHLSLRLATMIGGFEILSADSRQVYRGMDIGTAKVTAGERALAPHHGLDLVAPDEPFSVSLYQEVALAALAGISDRGRVAMLVGGTGLYIDAVARGVPYDEAPHDAEVRARLETELAELGLPACAERLRQLAPSLAGRTDLANPRRVVRALERAILVGDRSPAPPRGYPAPVLWLGLRLDHAVHRERIANRAAGQFAGGLLTEAARLRSRFSPDLPALSALGYREAIAVVEGRMTREAALGETIVRTRAYARRQRTWFGAAHDIRWLDADGDPLSPAQAAVERFLAAVRA
jgi:tRNA dimethylallyltransferase